MSPDRNRLDAFVGQLLNDMGAATTGAMVLIGDKLGLYKALAAANRSPRPNSRHKRTPPSAMSASGSLHKPQRAMSNTRRRPDATS